MTGYFIRENKHNVFFISELYVEDLFKLVMKNLMKMLKKYLTEVKSDY
jgi:hypothetical protein